jgi:hypothetical protein
MLPSANGCEAGAIGIMKLKRYNVMSPTYHTVRCIVVSMNFQFHIYPTPEVYHQGQQRACKSKQPITRQLLEHVYHTQPLGK